MDILLTDIQERLTAKVAQLKYVDEDWASWMITAQTSL